MKISYHKRYNGNSAVYNQTISMTTEEYSRLQDCFNAELSQGLPRKREYIFTSGYKIFMKPLVKTANICFLNHTQLRFVNIFLKLKLKDRNTCLLIKP